MKHLKKLALLTMAAFLFAACGGAVEDRGTVVDTTAPNFIIGDPPDGSDVTAACSVTAEFDDPLLASTITEQSFVIKDSTDTPLSSADGTWGLSPYSNMIALFVPLTATIPVPDDTYTVTLTTDITNAAGINLETEQFWTFTTTGAANVACTPT